MVLGVAAQGMTDDRQWWQRPFRMFQTNIREIDAGMDVEQVADQISAYGANTWLLSVGGIISNYPSELEHQSVNPNLRERSSGDLIGDAIQAAHTRGLRVLARMDFSKIGRRIAEEHPDWVFVDPDGARQVYQGLTSVCPSGDYYQVKIFEVLEEVLARYEIDGFFFNWMSYNEIDYDKNYRGVCQCMACQKGFSEATGLKRLPQGPDDETYSQWELFAQGVIDDLLARVRRFIAERRSQAALIMGDTADIIFHEANNAIGRDLWPWLTQEQVSVAKAFRPEVPVLVNSVAFLDMPYRLVSEDPRHFEQYLVQTLARGGIPSTYIMGTQNEFPYPSLMAGKEIFEFHRSNEDLYDGLAPASKIGLIRPSMSKLGLTAGRGDELLEEFRGFWQALSEHHLPFDALPVDRVVDMRASGGLSRYAVLILPDLGTLNPTTAKALDDWVNDGGRLLLTGSSGFDRQASQLKSSGLSQRTAILDTPEATWSSIVLPEPGDSSGALPILGSFHVVEPLPGTAVEGVVWSRAPYGPPEKCYGHLPLSHPSALRVDHGSGTTMTLPWTPGLAYRAVGLSSIAEYLSGFVTDLLGSDIEVETDLPSQVEVVSGVSRKGGILHLLNRSGHRHQGFVAALPIQAGHRLRWSSFPRNGTVRGVISGQELKTDDQGYVVLPALGLFEVLVVQP